MSKILLALALTAVSCVAFASETNVSRTDKTAEKSIYYVGDCVMRTYQGPNGNLLPAYDLSTTYCQKYVTYDATKEGSGWTAKYTKIPGTEKYFNQADSETQNFDMTLIPSGDDVTDAINNIAVLLSLRNQCNAARDALLAQKQAQHDPLTCQ